MRTGVSVVSIAELGITVWLVDIEKVEGGSVATFHAMGIVDSAVAGDKRLRISDTQDGNGD